MKGVRVPINWETRLFGRRTRRISSLSVIGYRVRVLLKYPRKGFISNHQLPWQTNRYPTQKPSSLFLVLF